MSNMPKGRKNMDNKSDEHFIIMQAKIEANKQKIKSNKQYSDEKMMKLIEDLKKTPASTITSMTYHINTSKSLPSQKDPPNPQDPTTVVTDNRRAPPLDGGHSTKIGIMWNIKREIILPKFYELLIKTELKGSTAPENETNYYVFNGQT